jgi:hypothetical protein
VEDNDASRPSEIDKFAKIKAFLQFYGPLTIESYVHLPESLTNPVPSNYPDQLKLNLVSKIRRSLEVIDKSAIELVQERMGIAKDLKSLHDAFEDSNSNEFYQFLHDTFHIKKRYYQYYQSYFKFLERYPLFQRIPVTLSDLCLITGKIESWFKSAECSGLLCVNSLLVQTLYRHTIKNVLKYAEFSTCNVAF